MGVDPGRDVGAPGPGGSGVLADEPGDVVVGHPCPAMIPHGVEQRCLWFRAGVEDGGVAAEVPGRLAGDGQAPGFGAFPSRSAVSRLASMPARVRASISASRAARSYMRIMKNWSRSPSRVPGSGAASSAVTASVVMYLTGAAAGPLSRGTAARSAR